MRIHTTLEENRELCPEDDAMNGWLEETSVYVSVAAVDDGDVDDPPSDV
jgi:hypothetical protein